MGAWFVCVVGVECEVRRWGCADWEFEVERLMWLELVVSVWLVGLIGVAETCCGWCGRSRSLVLSFVSSLSLTGK